MLDKTNEIHPKRYYIQLDVFSTLTQVFTKKKKHDGNQNKTSALLRALKFISKHKKKEEPLKQQSKILKNTISL